MKDLTVQSPFAAKTSQEQKEQWIWWQCQKDAVTPVTEELGQKQETIQEEMEAAPVMKRPRIYHSQYDAVIKRMKHATSQVGDYTSVSEEMIRQS